MTSFLRVIVVKWPILVRPKEVRVFRDDGKHGSCVNFLYACFDFACGISKVSFEK